MDTNSHKNGTESGPDRLERTKNFLGNGKKQASPPRTSRPRVEGSARESADNPERLQRPSVDGTAWPGAGGTVATQFDFQGQVVRTVAADGETWFVAADVCVVLEHTDPSSAVSRLEDDEKGAATVRTPGGNQEMKVVSESGLYALVFTSRKPQAKAFRKWVTGQVLPAIRRTGSYDTAATGRPGREGARLVELPGDGLYVVTALPGRATHIRQSGFEDIGPEIDALDAQIMACALATTAALWKRVQQISATGCDPTGSLPLNRFELAVLEGHQLAQRHFRAVETEGRSQEK